jgi:4-amino-4-deoxy-L-arabinose transferase-like glycosyltransferase
MEAESTGRRSDLFASDSRLGVILFLVGLATRLAFVLWRGPHLTPDSKEYLIIAQNLVAHGAYSLDTAAPFTPTVRFPPLYPAFLAVLNWLGASLYGVAVTQAIIGAACVVLLFLLTRMVTARLALIAALVYALHPGAIAATRSILSETVFTFLLLLGILLLATGLRREKTRVVAFSGVCFGLAILCRPVVMLLPFVLAGVIVIHRKLARRYLYGLLMLALSLGIIAPWALRSSLIANRLVMIQDSAVVATLFYVPTRLDWDQADEVNLWPRMSGEVERLRTAEIERGDHAAKDAPPHRLLIRAGLRNIWADPLAYFATRLRTHPYLFLTSYDSFTGINNSLGTLVRQRDLFRLVIKLCLLAAFSLIPFVLALIGLIQSRKNLAAILAAIVWLYLLVMYFPLWVEPRYWLPAVPFLLVSAAVGASSCLDLQRQFYERFTKQRRRTSSPSAEKNMRRRPAL